MGKEMARHSDRPIFEALEPRLLLDGSPVLDNVLPLPLDGGTVSAVIDKLTIDVSENLDPGGVNDPASWELREVGPDDTLDTSDDVISPLAVNPAYTTGTTITIDILPAAGSSPSPLQPGEYRFTARASSLADLAGSPLDGNGDGTGGDDFIRTFSVVVPPGTVVESASNDTSPGPAADTTADGGADYQQGPVFRDLSPESPYVADLSPPDHTNDPNIRTITLTLSEPVVGEGARDPATYTLLLLGPDRAPGGGDDIPIAVTPSYVDDSTRIDLHLAAPLPEGPCQLTARSGEGEFLRDLVGSPLDQDRDGFGDDFVTPIEVDFTAPTVDAVEPGTALSFDGNDYVITDNRAWGFSTSATVSAWVRTTDTGAVLSLAHGTHEDELLLCIRGGGKATIFNYKNAGNYTCRGSDTSVNTGQWVHIAGVMDGGGGTENLRIFVNGVEETGASGVSGSPSDITDDTLRRVLIGWRGNWSVDEALIGDIAEVRLWDHALTPAEIAADMNVQLTGTERGLAGCWRFDEGVGETAADLTANGSDGVLGGGSAANQPTWAACDAPTERSTIRVTYSDLGGMDAASVTDPANYRLRASGRDGTFGDGNEVDLTANLSAVAFDEAAQVATLRFSAPFAEEYYQLTVDGTTSVTDAAGNLLLDGADFVSETLQIAVEAAAVTIDMQAGSDSGVSDSDELTHDTTPTFDVTVNKRGRIDVDYDGDGESDAFLDVAGPGTYAFTPEVGRELADGDYSVQATFTPWIGDVATDSLPIAIDTMGPVAVPTTRAVLAPGLWVTRVEPAGPAEAPFDKLEMVFSLPIDDETFGPEDVQLADGGGAPLGAPIITRLGAQWYELDFTGLTGAGIYTLAIGPEVLSAGDSLAMDQDHNSMPGEATDAYDSRLISTNLIVPDGDTTYDELNLLVAGVTLTIDGPHALRSLALFGGAVARHSATTTSRVYRLELAITDGLWIDAASRIDVSYRGYYDGYTAGNMRTGGATGASGGSYGGLGRPAYGSTNWVYGDYLAPNHPGSGGWGTGSVGSGGGLVRITAGTAVIDGGILANGENGWHVTNYGHGGAGSGGGIRLDVGVLSGGGWIRADGGHVVSGSGGPGGGGRVAIYYEDMSGFDAAHVTAHGGTGGAGAVATGTVYLKDNAGEGVLRIDSHGATTGMWTPLRMSDDATFVVDRLVLSGSGVYAAPEHQGLPIQANYVDVQHGAALTHQYTTAGTVHGLEMTVAGMLMVDADSRIDVSYRGYYDGYTVGNTKTGGATGASGGSYGGLGRPAYGSTNWVYGDYLAPNHPGSGGCGTGSVGSGGGLARITAGTAVIDGGILANGENGWHVTNYGHGGAGSGGGIRLDVGVLSGGGWICADGGHVVSGSGGPGGGGRVAIYYEDMSGFDAAHVTAHGGTGGAGAAATGTVYLKDNAGEGVLRIDSHGATTGMWTPLGMSTEGAFFVDCLIVSGTGVLAAPEHAEMPIQANNVDIVSGGVLLHQQTTASKVYSLEMTVANRLFVDVDSAIGVTGRGYVVGYTFGNTRTGGATGWSGGSYGGHGASTGGGASPAAYGDPLNPNEPGSGGWGDGAVGSGGGLVRITAGTVVVDGRIVADGGNGWHVTNRGHGGAGSGGGIRLDVGMLVGAGTISANGGNVTGGSGGAGGGGRVAVYWWDELTLPEGNITADAGAGGGGTAQNGSVRIAQTSAPTDLTIAVDSAPASAVIGQAIFVSWTTTNRGDEATSSPWFDHVYLSVDSVWDASDRLIRAEDVSRHLPLAGRTSYSIVDREITIPFDAATGSQYLLFVADGSENQAEFTEMNNAWPSAIEILPTLPDLMIRNVADGEFTGDDVYNATAAGQKVSQQAAGGAAAIYVLKLQNDRDVAESFRITGSGGTAGWTVRYYDAPAGGADITADVTGGGWPAASLPAGGEVELRLEVTPDLNVSAGEVFDVAVMVVSAGAPANLDRVKAVIEGAGGVQPDLVIAPTDVPGTADWGQTVQVTWTVTNSGPGDALRTWWDYVYISDDEDLDDGDTLLVSQSAGEHSPLAAGGDYSYTRGFIVPHTRTRGRFLLLIADGRPDQPETNEDNNIAAVPIELHGPDLIVTDLDWPAGGFTDGQAVTVSAKVENVGTGAAPSGFHVRFEVDGEYVGLPAVGEAIPAGGFVRVEQIVTAETGVHSVRAIADEQDAVFEWVEDNNDLAADLPEVLAPDLRVTGITWLPEVVTDKDVVTFTVTIENIGLGDTVADFHVRFEIDGQFAGRQRVTGGMASGESLPLELTWPAVPGDHTIAAIVDEYSAVSESDETNNDRAEPLGNIADETAPRITSLLPPEGSKVRAVVTLRATASDAVGVTNYSFALSADQQDWAPLGSDAGGEIAWDTATLGDSTQYVRVTVEDAAGNSSQMIRTCQVDNTAPPAQALTAEGVELGVMLSWADSPVSDLAYYRLHRSTTPGGPYAAVNGAMTQTSFVDRDVAVGTTYYYVLTIFDHVGSESDPSDEISAAPLGDITAPDIHSMTPSDGARSATVFNLSASATDNVGVTDYTFEYSDDNGEIWQPIASGASSTAVWNVSAAATGDYAVRVTVSDTGGNDASMQRTYEVDHDPPAAPENLRLTPGEVTVVVAWDPVVSPDFHHYELFRSTAGGAFSAIVPETTSTVYVDEDVIPATVYTYRAVAVDALGNVSGPSNEESAEPLDDTTDPIIQSMIPPDGTRVSGQAPLSAVVRDNVLVVAVRFEYSPAGAGNWTLIGQDDAPAHLFADRWQGGVVWDTEALADGEYDFRATAVDYGANEDFLTHTVIMDRAPPTEPHAPGIVNPGSSETLDLTWAEVADDALDGYSVYRSEVPGTGYALVASTRDLSYTDSGLTNGVTYYYVITATDEAGNESAASPEASGVPTAECDLAVAEVAFEPPVPILAREGDILATIENDGPAAASTEARFYRGDSQTGVLLGTTRVTVGASQSRTVRLAWTPEAAGADTITVALGDIAANDLDDTNDEGNASVAVNTAPVADAGDDRVGNWNSPIGFDGTASYDDDGLVVSYDWDFGDGETSEHGLIDHAYMLPGTYTATLTVTDNRGAVSQDTCQITVNDTRADVVVSELSWTPAEPEERDEITITATIANVGNGPTIFGFFTTFYIDGLYKGYRRINDLLEIGDTVQVTFGWTATKGLHTVRVVADDIQNNIAETNEDNNEGAAALTLQQIYFPELLIEDLACEIPDATVSSEVPLAAAATVANRGTADAFDFWVSLYVDGEFVTRRHVPELVADGTADLTFQFEPLDGAHTLTVVADDPVSYVLESDEDNNEASLVLPELTLAYPDLAAGGVTVRPTETVLAEGTSLDISVSVENLGAVAVEHAFEVGFYVDGEYIGSREVTYLGAGLSQTLAFQTRATPGEHTAEVVIDEAGTVRESDESNNTASADVPELTILYPDLVVSDVDWAPANPKYGDIVYFTCSVSNTTVVSTLTTFVFELYVDGEQVAIQELPRLSGHATQPFTVSWKADVDPMTGHTIRAVVDTKDDIHEEDETNNEFVVAEDFHVGDNFAMEVEANGVLDEIGLLVYTNREVAEFTATVQRGSSPEPVGPGVGLEIHATVVKAGQEYWDEESQEWRWSDDEVLFDETPMTFLLSLEAFRFSIDLLTYGTGDYSVTIVATDGVDTVSELLNMTVIEEVNFTLETDQEVYRRAQGVEITGNVTTLSGQPVAGEKVALLITRGWSAAPGMGLTKALFDEDTRQYAVMTNAFGNFEFTFQPLWGDAGRFSVDAFVYSEVYGTSGHAEFSILALDFKPARLNVTTTTNRTFSHVLTLQNLGEEPLTGLQVDLLDEQTEDNVTATIAGVPETLASRQMVPVTIAVQIPEDAPGEASFVVSATTNEGMNAQSRVYLTLKPATPSPAIGPNVVSVALNPGGFFTKTLTLTNQGMGTMSDITLVPPATLPWVTPVGPVVGELAPGESTTFDVLISPSESVRPGTYLDRIIATDGTHQAEMVVMVEISSANRGSVSFVISNDAGQVVSGAEVKLVSREAFAAVSGDGRTSTYHNVYHARSNAQGVATIEDVPIGDYDYGITAAGHEVVRDVAAVMPASDARIIPVEMVAVPLTYKWTVTPIVIEDRYEITLELGFQVDIPKPQFVFLPPWVAVPHELDSGFRDQLIVVNPSLVELKDVTAEVVGAEGIALSAGGQIGTMGAKTSATLGFAVAPGDYGYLDGGGTYIQVSATYVAFDPITLEPLDERELIGKIPLVNPSKQTVKIVAPGGGETMEIGLPGGGSGAGGIPGIPGGGEGLPEKKVSEVVTIEIAQEATMEREGFDARLELINGMDRELVSLSIHPRVTDADGLDVTDRFYIVPPELEGISAVDGSGNLGEYAAMNGRWILIPGEGLGGTDLAGKSYRVKAVMNYYVDGRLTQTQTNSVEITVHPQPKLYLHYYVPEDVLADVPFKLGVLIENEGDGIARNLKIDSAQPEMAENESGLLIEFRIVGSSFGSTTGDIVRVVFGDVQPHSTAHGYWIMQSSLSGAFVSFTAELKHLAYKGIEINPLILDVTTEIILHDNLFADAQDPNNCFSLIDRDKDGFPDYLVNLWSGLHLPITIPEAVNVTRSPTEQDRTMALEVPDTAGYACVILPDPMPEANIRAIIRHGADGEDDTILSGNNFWKEDGKLYFVDELGAIDEFGVRQPQTGVYTIDMRSALAVEEVNCAPREFSAIWSTELGSEQPWYTNPEAYTVHEPVGDSLLTTYELKQPIFYIPLPPTVGQKAAVRAVLTNNGVTPESGWAEIRLTKPDGTEELLHTYYVDELHAWRHEEILIDWVPDVAGEHTITVSLPGDSPQSLLELPAVVNALPYADAGVDFFSDVQTTTKFDGTRSYDPDGYLHALFWDFDDGAWGGGMGPTHVYNHSGTRQVRTIVKDNHGAMTEDVMMVTIEETRPDLMVESIAPTPARPAEGEEVTITAVIRNSGFSATEEGTFHVSFYVDGAFQEIATVTRAVAPDDTVEVDFTWTAEIENHIFNVAVDDHVDLVDEADEKNNRLSVALYPDQTYFPELVVEDVHLSIAPDAPIDWGDSVEVLATIRNVGTRDAGRFRASLYIDDVPIEYAAVDELSFTEGANTVEVGIPWTPGHGDHVITVRADDPLNHVVESDETNNACLLDVPELNFVYGDLVVRDVAIWPADGRVDYPDPLVLFVQVANDSEVDVLQPVGLRIYSGSLFIGQATVEALAGGSETWLVVDAEAVPGTSDLRVVVDERDEIPEQSETNNSFTLPGTAITVDYPDLVVMDITHRAGVLQYGQDVTFLVRVRNEGLGRTYTPFNINLLVDGHLAAAHRQNVMLIPGGTMAWEETWTVDIPIGGTVIITAEVDPLGEAIETNELNNQGAISLDSVSAYIVDLSSDKAAYTVEETGRFTVSVADAAYPATPLGPSNGVTAVLTIQDDGGATRLTSPMTYDGGSTAFLLDVSMDALDWGDYTAMAEVVGPYQTVRQYLDFSVMDFSVTIEPDRAAYIHGEEVVLSGTVEEVDGSPMEAVLVHVTVEGFGAGWTEEVVTDDRGDFAYAFPAAGDMGGAYTVDACVIYAEMDREASGEFTIEGMFLDPRISTTAVSSHVPENTEDITLTLVNIGTRMLTDLEFELVDTDPGDDYTATLAVSPVEIPAGAEGTIVVTVEAAEGTDQAGGSFVLEATGSAGPDISECTAEADIVVELQEPKYLFDPPELLFGVNPYSHRPVIASFRLINDGNADMTGLTMDPRTSLPWVWFEPLTRTTIAPGEWVEIEVFADPDPDTVPNDVYGFDVLFNSNAEDPGQSTPYHVTIEVTHVITSTLEVTVTDDWGILVEEAEVYVRLMSSDLEEAAREYMPARYAECVVGLSLLTDANGRCTFEEIIAGDYAFEICADARLPHFAAKRIFPGTRLQKAAYEMVFTPTEFEWEAEQSTEEQSLGQWELGLVMTVRDPDRDFLVTDRPALEVFLPYDSASILTGKFSINNMGLNKVLDVYVETEFTDPAIFGYRPVRFGSTAPAVRLYANEIGAKSGVLLPYQVDPAELPPLPPGVTDDILDGVVRILGTYYVDGIPREVRISMPIRIRRGVEKEMYRGEEYGVVPCVTPWPTGPLEYGRSFTEKFHELAGAGTYWAPITTTGREGQNLTISHDVSVEGEVFEAQMRIWNLQERNSLDDITTHVVITTEPMGPDGIVPAGANVLDLFEIDEVVGMPTAIAPRPAGPLGAPTLGRWIITPRAGAGGSDVDGQEYYVYVIVRYKVQGVSAKIVESGTFTVEPSPNLAIRYSVDKLGELLEPGETFQIYFSVTNMGPGRVGDLKIRYPGFSGISDPTAVIRSSATVEEYVGGRWVADPFATWSNVLTFGDLEPDETKRGFWKFEVLKEFRIPTTFHLFEPTGRGNVELGILKAQPLGSGVEEDLVNALEELRDATLDKLDYDAEQTFQWLESFYNSVQDFTTLLGWIQTKRLASIFISWFGGVMSILGMIDPFFWQVDLPVGYRALWLNANSIYGTAYEVGDELVNALLNRLDTGQHTSKFLDAVRDGLDLVHRRTDSTYVRDYVNNLMPIFLIDDYDLWDFAGSLDPGMHPDAWLHATEDYVSTTWARVNGTEQLREQISGNFDMAEILLTSEPLPAYYPIGPLWREYWSLTRAIERSAAAWQWVPENIRFAETNAYKNRKPVGWYSVGEGEIGPSGQTEWLPVFLRPWQFGSQYEPVYALGRLLEHQSDQFRYSYEVLKVEALFMYTSLVLNSMGTVPVIGTGATVLGWMVDSLMEDQELALEAVRGNIEWGFEQAGNRLVQMADALADENQGLWRMTSDIRTHLAFLHVNRPVDPPVSLFVESINTPDILIGREDPYGRGAAHVVVRNDGDLPVDLTGRVHLFTEDIDLAAFDVPPIHLDPGETGTIEFQHAGMSSSHGGIHGFEAEIRFEAIDPDTHSTIEVGPYLSHYYVDTEEELALYRRQAVSQPLGGTINPGENREVAIVPTSSARRMRVLLAQPDAVDIDLHAYDSAGNHVGLNYETGEADLQLPGTAYSGPDVTYEWICFDVPEGEEYRLVVEAVDVPLDTQFVVSLLEVPEYPAMLQMLNPAMEKLTNERTVELPLAAAEYGRQRDVNNVVFTITDLTDGQGSVIAPVDVAFELPETTIAAGEALDWIATVTIPDGLPDGTYSGIWTISGTDAVSGAVLTDQLEVALQLDTTAPPVPTLNDVGSTITQAPVLVSGAAPDDALVEVLMDGELLTIALYFEDGTFYASADIPAGEHVLTARTLDEVGNYSEESDPVTVFSEVDLDTPVTTATLTGVEGADGWYTSDVTVELLAEDEPLGSGVAGTLYSLNGSEFQDYTEPLAFTDDGTHTVWFYSTDVAGNTEWVDTIEFDINQPAEIAECHIFYNNSAWDNNDPMPNADDDAAIAVDKSPLLPGETADFVNYTSYSRGINGIMVDIANQEGAPTVDDFIFRVGNDNYADAWATAPLPTSVTVRPGAGTGGSDRVTIIWADNAIAKQWLQVTVKANSKTDLDENHVFYFGNAIGEAGGSTANAKVNITDRLLVRHNQHTLSDPALIDDTCDFNRDKEVNTADELIVQNNYTMFLTALKLIAAPTSPGGLPGAIPPVADITDEPAVLMGDADKSGAVDADDMAILTGTLGLVGEGLAADFNSDGSVNLVDFAILRGNFGKTLSSAPAAPAPSALVAAAQTPAAPPVIPIARVSPGDTPTDDTPIAIAESGPAINLLTELPTPDNYIPEFQPMAMGSSATTPYLAAPAERDPRTLGDDLLSGSIADITSDGLDVPLSSDDLEINLLADSDRLAVLMKLHG